MSKRSIKKRHGNTPSFKELCQQGELRKKGFTGFDKFVEEQMKNPDFAKAFEQAMEETQQAQDPQVEDHVHGEHCQHDTLVSE